VQRWIDLDGCHNFRDLGGYSTHHGRAVRWRVLFRSDALDHLGPSGVERLRDELGIEDVVDLRSSRELGFEGRGRLARESIRFHHLPLFDGETPGEPRWIDDYTLADRYFLMVDLAGEPIARVITLLAETSAPTVYHCAAGKDRTGVVSAVLLGLLGVRDEIIVADYAASQENLDAIIDRLMSTKGYQKMFETLPFHTLHAEPETMIALLDKIRARYGSMRDYAREIGVSDATVARLEARLLA
jgi:protein tyrosine/serine phosphatase